MDYFNYHQQQLYAEDVPVSKIIQAHGTPCYVYSKATLKRHYEAFAQAFHTHPHHICYSVKANFNLAILQLLAQCGAWFDIVSQGELERVLKAGGKAEKIIFSGVGKKHEEIKRALEIGIFCFNVESTNELLRINEIAGLLHKKGHISIRVNPDIDAQTHPYISTGLKDNKFGIASSEVIQTYLQAKSLPHIKIVGIDCHIGSQILELSPFKMAIQRILQFVDELKTHDIHLSHIDMGGGLGVCYSNEQPPSVEQYAQTLLTQFTDKKLSLLIEPGRALIGNAGILLAKVEYLKTTPTRNFAIIDAAMNDLLRPALYSAWQNVISVRQNNNEKKYYDIVGPVCETSDFLAKERLLAINEGDYLAIRTAGAYGFSMSSQYNSRPRAAEVLVCGRDFQLIRERETWEDLWDKEKLL